MSNKDDSGPGRAGRGQASTSKDHKSPPGDKEPLSEQIKKTKCSDCCFAATSVDKLKSHVQTVHHKQLMQPKAEKTKKTETADAPGVPGMVPDYIRRSLYVLNDYVRRKDREPLIGLEYVLEYKVQLQVGVIQIKYFCEVCEMDSPVVTMVDHLCGFRHRKLYVTKKYPYVLPAVFKVKEDQRPVFMRRMAMEIEQEEGIKEYKTDPIIRTVALMNVKSTEAKQSKRGTRWNSESEKQKKMNDALACLDSLTIANEKEAGEIKKLYEKVQAEIKTYTDKLKEEALFSAKVTRAKDAAISIMRNAVKERVAQLPSLMKIPYNKVIEVPENFDVRQGKGIPGPLRPNKPNWAPHAGFPPRPPGHPFPPANQRHNFPIPAENAWRDQLASLDVQIDENDEDFVFLKKLMALLDLLPQTPTVTDDPEMDSKFQMLKSFLLDDTASIENMPTDQLLLQLASLTQGMTGMEDLSLNPLSALMAPNNPPAAGEFGQVLTKQMAPPPVDSAQANQDALMQIAALLQNSQGSAASFFPEKRNVPNPEYRQTDDHFMMPKDQTAYRQQYMNRQPGFASTSQSGEDFGYDQPMARRYGGAATSPYDDLGKSRDYRSHEPTQDLYAERRYDSGMSGREWDEPPYSNTSMRGARQEYDDYTSDQPYSWVSQRSDRFQENPYDQDLRREDRELEDRPGYGAHVSRSFDDPPWAGRESEPYYGKRTKLDILPMSSRDTDQRKYYLDESDSPGMSAPNLSADLLKKIRGKDLFTASAILSEYADSHSS